MPWSNASLIPGRSCQNLLNFLNMCVLVYAAFVYSSRLKKGPYLTSFEMTCCVWYYRFIARNYRRVFIANLFLMDQKNYFKQDNILRYVSEAHPVLNERMKNFSEEQLLLRIMFFIFRLISRDFPVKCNGQGGFYCR